MEFITNLISPETLETIAQWVVVIVTIASAVGTALPSVGNNKIYNFAMKALNFLALNVGKNKNADAE